MHLPPQNDPHLFWSKSHEFGVNSLLSLNEVLDQEIEQIGIQAIGQCVYRDLSVAESVASSGDKPVVVLQQTPLQHSLADRSVFLSAPPPNPSLLFTPTCHASRVMKCAVISDQEEEGIVLEEAMEGQMNLMSAPPPRLLPAPECADAFTSRWFIAAPQRTNIESSINHQPQYQNHHLDVANVATTSICASAHASGGDFFNSNNYCNNECFDGGNCLGNSSVFWENYHHNHSSLEQYQQQNISSNFSFNNNQNLCINNQNNLLINNNNNYNNHNNQNNYSNYLSPPQYLASAPSSSSSSTNNNWHLWIDDLIKEVQAEVSAEKKLFCMDRRSSLTYSDISANVGSVQTSDDDEKVNCSTRFESGSVVSPSLYSQSSSGCSSSSSIGCSPYSFNGTIPSSIQKQPILSNSDIQSNKSAKRAKKNSLQTLSREELAERKKQQNRVAAQRYRNRRTRTLESERSEIDELESRNAQMREELGHLAKEIEKLRGQLLLSR